MASTIGNTSNASTAAPRERKRSPSAGTARAPARAGAAKPPTKRSRVSANGHGAPAAMAAAVAGAANTTLGTTSRNVDGKAIAITVFTTLKWPGRIWLPAVFFVGTHVPTPLARTLAKLSFIHFARWTLVREMPDNGQPDDTLHYPRLYFESNFNGGWAEYIDAFSHILTTGMKIFWGTSYGFPQPLPTGPFKVYIQRNELPASHFYSAYPQGTTTMVLSGLALEEKLERFEVESAQLTDEDFAASWGDFLADVQGLI
jgi:hypothetical protein